MAIDLARLGTVLQSESWQKSVRILTHWKIWRRARHVKSSSRPKTILTKQGHTIEYYEQDATSVKLQFDEIDTVLARLYSFTEEELDFIINYDIKYRMGVDGGDDAAYVQPILQALAGLGGKGKMADVLDKVLALMKPVLKDVDFQPLASDPETPRWRNAAQWARNTMVQDGLIKSDSPRGTWEMTDAGRAFVKQRSK